MAEDVRKPLISGNWKMHHTHLDAIAMIQKLSYLLFKEDYEEVDVSIHPAFTALAALEGREDPAAAQLRQDYQSKLDARSDPASATTPVAAQHRVSDARVTRRLPNRAASAPESGMATIAPKAMRRGSSAGDGSD